MLPFAPLVKEFPSRDGKVILIIAYGDFDVEIFARKRAAESVVYVYSIAYGHEKGMFPLVLSADERNLLLLRPSSTGISSSLVAGGISLSTGASWLASDYDESRRNASVDSIVRRFGGCGELMLDQPKFSEGFMRATAVDYFTASILTAAKKRSLGR